MMIKLTLNIHTLYVGKLCVHSKKNPIVLAVDHTYNDADGQTNISHINQ